MNVVCLLLACLKKLTSKGLGPWTQIYTANDVSARCVPLRCEFVFSNCCLTSSFVFRDIRRLQCPCERVFLFLAASVD